MSCDLRKANKTITQFSSDKKGLNAIIDDQNKKIDESEESVRKQEAELKNMRADILLNDDENDVRIFQIINLFHNVKAGIVGILVKLTRLSQR